jgi:4-diphosphocytidyl-2-C-methyl-D-erythritol kinase
VKARAAPRRVTLRAPAKLNLGLRITGRRADGYHELDSVFVPLDLADDLVVEVAPAEAPAAGLILDGAAPGLAAGAENLATRAALAFLEAAGLCARVSLRLTKHIPVAAGLGGGSSDAAAVLRALAELHPGAVVPADLAALALRIGADVPYFLDPRPARVRGIGERVESVSGLPPLSLLLVHPGAPLSTAAVYRAYDALGPVAAARTRVREAHSDAAPLPAGIDLGNDLEPAAVRLCPPVARLRARMQALDPLGVGMSGSGPTLFGIFAEPSKAEAARQRAALEAPAWARVARSVGSR